MKAWLMFLFLGVAYIMEAQDIKNQNCDVQKKVVELDRFKHHLSSISMLTI